jgi:hypothetical protein
MEYVPSMAVTEAAKQLKCKPFLLDIFKERSSTHAIIDRAVEVLSNKESVGLRLDYPLIRKSVRYICQSFSFLYKCTSEAVS